VKLLRNPIAVAVLVVLAVAVIAYQFWPMFRSRFARSSPPPSSPAPAPAVAHSTPAKPAKPPADLPATTQAPTSTVETVVLESNWVRWVEAPRNDPFKVRFYVKGPGTNRPAMEDSGIQNQHHRARPRVGRRPQRTRAAPLQASDAPRRCGGD